ncbi:Uma2 family endonuclease [Fervidibacter sacchari]|uniref:Uma2 family endonuclease n=1 Tax=Candidatus Fervidibacter sacchari TaxID=1448929 RepID=A0ABT2EIC6_9BACT|nr:Uma2 family endonuclease [Candidatus Fervidibacter sacchari]MCS3917708.1 Uma2 family endonuclease [Candidatus Fervidibacter sacchari]WKU15535.1 Uma2 family endonuclease [Candidatus Fervidibacter sacchari]
MVAAEEKAIPLTLGVQRRKFSKAEYYRMAEMGFFNGQRVELIDGEVILMSPQEASHATAVGLVADTLQSVFSEGFIVRVQQPLDLGEVHEPEPDVAVVSGQRRDYATSHPKTAVLVVEVALTSVDYDRNVKSSLYAKAGIPEYWLLNLRDRRLEVFREPVPMPEQIFGFGYKSMRIYLPEETVSPLAKPDAKIKVADMLP